MNDADSDIGMSTGMFYGGLLILLILFIIIVEIRNVYNVKSAVTKELNRAANIGIITAMDDEYRKDGISRVNSALARDAFFDYATEVLKLDSNMEHESGAVKYRLAVSTSVVESPPVLNVNATLYLKPIFVQGLVEKHLGSTLEFKIPIEVHSKNQRLD